MKKVTEVTLTILTGLLFGAGELIAQTTVSTETTYDGTISNFDPGTAAFVVSSDAGPRSYSYTKETQFVDADGHVVSYESLRGQPVTVYYAADGDRVVVRRVQVRRPVAHVTEETTTTTTTAPAHKVEVDHD